ncbi:MAG: anhydro-N-acetylmuramic acid kinase [Saprospiraceae bacterium]|nr:anhydro-N-acetylmuramic acid kinase [Saprospiraceae bacterium]
MRLHLQQLHHLSQAPVRHILGLMSGTSLDGLDMALCAVSGAGLRTKVQLLAFETAAYTDDFRQAVRRVFARRDVDQLTLTLLNVQVAEAHARLVRAFLQKNGQPRVDLLASHGQTVFHAPRNWHGVPGAPNATLQLGDGDHLAVRTGLITVCDFRQKHVAFGGEGAPLALYGDVLLFSDDTEDRFLLNIGGIANFTWLPATRESATLQAFATDTGPGNTLIDAAARHLFSVPFDRDGLLAARGQVLDALLDNLMADPFLAMPTPKTTGPERFSWETTAGIIDRMPKGHHNPYDLMATLTEYTARSIGLAIRNVARPDLPAAVYVSGGGADNPELCRRLQRHLPALPLRRVDALGIPANAKEAVLFALLANETVAGEPLPGVQGMPWMGMGKIALPG